jgi:hypothetical protein
MVRGWDASNTTQTGARKGPFEKVMEAAVEVRGTERRHEWRWMSKRKKGSGPNTNDTLLEPTKTAEAGKL